MEFIAQRAEHGRFFSAQLRCIHRHSEGQMTRNRSLNFIGQFYQRQLRRVRRKLAIAQVPLRPNNRQWSCSLGYSAIANLQKGTLQYRYRGMPMLKNPIEVALYTQLVWDQKPRTIFEIG